MPVGEVVRVKNAGEEDFAGSYDQNTYRIKAGQESVVPKDAAYHWTGRAYLMDGRNKDRTEEYKRLEVYYGIFPDETGTIEEKRERNIPNLEVYTLDGDRIYTVLEDPKGDRMRPDDQTAHEKELLDDQISQLKRELATLTATLAQRETSPEYEPSLDVVDDVPDDKPTKVPVTDGPRRGRTARTS